MITIPNIINLWTEFLYAIFFVYENGAGYIFGPVFKKIICEAHNFVLEAIYKHKKYTII